MTNISPDLPLLDLHRHLDGSVRLQTILELGRKHNLPLPAFDLEGLRPHVQVSTPQPGLLEFLEKFKWMTGVLVDYKACRRIAKENLLDAAKEGIDYIELRFSPWFMAEPHGLDPAGVTEAVVQGVADGVRLTGVQANLIGILSRTYGAEICMKELDALLTQRDHITALDLAGDEGNYPGALFVEHFKRGRDAGWNITVHAGEAAGAESIWQAINDLGATRIGHGVRVDEDPALMETLAKRGIGVEVSLTSNLQTSTVPSYSAHPLKKMLDAGVKATINTDDPGISAIDLKYEYDVAAPRAGLTKQDIRQAQLNALEIAFLDEEAKSDLVIAKVMG